MGNEEAMQEKYMQFQMLQQQMEEINQELQMLMQQQAELELSINAVKELEKTKVNNEILAPLANGIFIKTELKDNQTLVVNVGSDVTVEKTIPEVLELLEKHQQTVNQKVIEMDLLMRELSSEAMEVYRQVNAEK